MSKDKQYVVRTQDYTNEGIEDAHIDENDPIHQIKSLAGLSNQNIGKLQEYKGPGTVKTEGSNPSITANKLIKHQQDNDIQPGSPEWFRLWFAKPYMTGEKAFDEDTNEDKRKYDNDPVDRDRDEHAKTLKKAKKMGYDIKPDKFKEPNRLIKDKTVNETEMEEVDMKKLKADVVKSSKPSS